MVYDLHCFEHVRVNTKTTHVFLIVWNTTKGANFWNNSIYYEIGCIQHFSLVRSQQESPLLGNSTRHTARSVTCPGGGHPSPVLAGGYLSPVLAGVPHSPSGQGVPLSWGTPQPGLGYLPWLGLGYPPERTWDQRPCLERTWDWGSPRKWCPISDLT